MRTSLTAAALLVAFSLFSGCVAEGKYRDLEQAYRQSQEQAVSLAAQIEELKQRIKLLEGDPAGSAAKIAQLEKELADAQAQITGWASKYDELSKKGGVVALPGPLNEALEAFAKEHPDLVEFDPILGMLKLKSDVTFKLGSADLSDNARNTLAQLATILNSPAASTYEVRVVGHTDSVRVSRPDTLAKHPDNWYLSVHRAISVRSALDKAGVPSVRTSVSGYGMYRPLVSNARGGAEKNRRVELYLVPMAPVNSSFLGAGGDGEPPRGPAKKPGKIDADIPLK
jgi:chemotaxis protein MotB